jgi:hypothetical protein
MRFQEAENIFADLREHHADLPLYALYQERCRDLLSEPPQENWDGVFTHKTK